MFGSPCINSDRKSIAQPADIDSLSTPFPKSGGRPPDKLQGDAAKKDMKAVLANLQKAGELTIARCSTRHGAV
jgi:hypothetical protein